MAFVINDPLPQNCTECNYRCGCNIIAREGNYATDCPIVAEIDHDTNLIMMDSAVDTLVDAIKTISAEYSEEERQLIKTIYESAIYRIQHLPIVLGKAVL